MTKKEQLINKLESFDERYFNDDQKNIAKRILGLVPEEEVQAFADFIFMKRKAGFAFDYSPEIAQGRLITLAEDIDRRINVEDEVQEDENKLIIGDNYNALKSLLVTHKGMVDMIYIDPPYNTESAKEDGNQSSKDGEANKFIYKDKYGENGWLNMMKTRLTIAKELLTDGGIIFASIDDHEQAHLKLLMDDVFGKRNFEGMLIWRKKTSSGKINKLGTRHEYILSYSMDYNNFNFLVEDVEEVFKYEDDYGPYNRENLQRGTSSTKPYEIIDNDGNKYLPAEGKTWRWSETKLKSEWHNVEFANGTVYTKTRPKGGKWPHTLLIDNKYGTSKSGKEDAATFVGKALISKHTPKPVSLIKHLIQISTHKDATVLDFFAGTGTTGQAVMELNREDGGNRRFILCTNNENNVAHDITFERIYRSIIGKTYLDKTSNFDWIKHNNIFENQKLRVININDDTQISLDQSISDDLLECAKNGLKLLMPTYNPAELNLYYDLAALNPLKKEEGK